MAVELHFGEIRKGVMTELDRRFAAALEILGEDTGLTPKVFEAFEHYYNDGHMKGSLGRLALLAEFKTSHDFKEGEVALAIYNAAPVSYHNGRPEPTSIDLAKIGSRTPFGIATGKFIRVATIDNIGFGVVLLSDELAVNSREILPYPYFLKLQ